MPLTSLLNINVWAVVLAAGISIVIGSLWFSPFFFGKQWMRHTRFTKRDIEKAKKKGMAASYILGFLAALVTALVLDIFLGFMGVASLSEGIQVSLLAWLGFVATIMINSVIWEGKPIGLFLIISGHQLVNLLIMGSLLAVL